MRQLLRHTRTLAIIEGSLEPVERSCLLLKPHVLFYIIMNGSVCCLPYYFSASSPATFLSVDVPGGPWSRVLLNQIINMILCGVVHSFTVKRVTTLHQREWPPWPWRSWRSILHCNGPVRSTGLLSCRIALLAAE